MRLPFPLIFLQCLSIAGSNPAYADAVDVYNNAAGTWSTARLSVKRAYLRGTSVGHMALFAGGMSPGMIMCAL
jgi:hypothetical protein